MEIAKLPRNDQIETLMKGAMETPVVMLNLLRFNERAEGEEEGTGQESYSRYAQKMQQIVEGAGGRFLFVGSADSQVIGDSDVDWDEVPVCRSVSVCHSKTLLFSGGQAVRLLGLHRHGTGGTDANTGTTAVTQLRVDGRSTVGIGPDRPMATGKLAAHADDAVPGQAGAVIEHRHA